MLKKQNSFSACSQCFFGGSSSHVPPFQKTIAQWGVIPCTNIICVSTAICTFLQPAGLNGKKSLWWVPCKRLVHTYPVGSVRCLLGSPFILMGCVTHKRYHRLFSKNVAHHAKMWHVCRCVGVLLTIKGTATCLLNGSRFLCVLGKR